MRHSSLLTLKSESQKGGASLSLRCYLSITWTVEIFHKKIESVQQQDSRHSIKVLMYEPANSRSKHTGDHPQMSFAYQMFVYGVVSAVPHLFSSMNFPFQAIIVIAIVLITPLA